MDDDDPMAVSSPIGKQGGYTNGYDNGPAKGWSHLGGGGMMVNLSMDDDVVDPIAASMELPDSRYDPQSQRRQSPVSSYQSDPYDQRLDPNQQYRQPSSGYSSYPVSNEPTWEWQNGSVRLNRNPTCGFGLAVIGGIDNPTNAGEISIIVKDILPNGPADVRLKKNDRLLKVNGISMENVEHAVAVGALRSAGDSVVIEYKRKSQAPAPISRAQTLPSYAKPPQFDTTAQTLPSYSAPPQFDTTDQSFNTGSYYTSPSERSASQPPTRRTGSQLSLTNSQGRSAVQREYVTLTKTRNEGFGMQLGWKLFVQGMSEYGVAANQGLQKGDTIVKINSYPVETLSLADAKRIIQTSGNSLNLEVVREPQVPQFSTSAYGSRSVDRLDRMSLGRGEEQQPPLRRGYSPQLHPQRQPSPSTNELLQEQDDDPLHSALPPRPPLPRVERAQHTFSMPPPRPPSPGKTEFMGHSTAL